MNVKIHCNVETIFNQKQANRCSLNSRRSSLSIQHSLWNKSNSFDNEASQHCGEHTCGRSPAE